MCEVLGSKQMPCSMLGRDPPGHPPSHQLNQSVRFPSVLDKKGGQKQDSRVKLGETGSRGQPAHWGHLGDSGIMALTPRGTVLESPCGHVLGSTIMPALAADPGTKLLQMGMRWDVEGGYVLGHSCGHHSTHFLVWTSPPFFWLNEKWLYLWFGGCRIVASQQLCPEWGILALTVQRKRVRLKVCLGLTHNHSKQKK